ncbi:hypothetical protein Tco_1187847, partial [Tanacetum coccineum]
RRPSILNRSSTQTTELPTQEDQICGYRAMTRGRYQAARATRERRANLVPAEVLYSNNRSTARHKVYQHYSKQRIMCINDNQTNLPLCNQQSYQSLRILGLQHIHLGIFMIRLHALHRRSAGINALVVLRDTRWEDSRQIIGTIEVDLSARTQLVYMFPDMVLRIDDFHNHVEVAIQTHGYDTWQGGESNLLVTMAMMGKLSNTSYMGFQYSVDNVVDHLTTTGITTIPGERRSVEELEGMRWNLKPSEQTMVHVPLRVEVNERLNRSLSLQFERYHRAPQPARYSVDQHEQEILDNDHLDEDEEHFIGICLQDPQTQHIPYDILLHLSKKEEKDDDLPYPKFRKFKQLAAQIINKHEEHAFPTALDDAESSTSYQPPPDAIMGPAVYPPEDKTRNQHINQTISLVILREKVIPFTEDMDFRQLVVKSGKLYFPSTTEKLFAKLPPSLSKKIEESFKAKHPGLSACVLPAIKFTHTFVLEMCKDAALAKELRDLSLCSAIPIPGYYKNNMKKYGIRKSRTYKGKPHNSHDTLQRIAEDIVLADFDDSSVYSISEDEGDFHQNISIMVQDTPFEEATFMAIEGINESDDEQSIEEDYYSYHAFMFHPGPPTKIADMVQSTGSWKSDKELPTQSKSCEHDWKENTVTNYTICYYYGKLTTDMSRLNCPKCQLITCAFCARNYLGKTVNVKGKQPHKPEEEKDFNSNEVRLLKELLKEKMEQVQQMIKDQAKEYYENRAIIQRKEELWQSERSLHVKDLTDALKIIDQLKIEQIRFEEQKDEEIRKLKTQLQKEKEKEIEARYSSEEFLLLGNSQIARPFMEAEVHYSGNTTTAPKVRKITNQI